MQHNPVTIQRDRAIEVTFPRTDSRHADLLQRGAAAAVCAAAAVNDAELDPASRGRGARGCVKQRKAEGRAAPAEPR